MKPVLINGEIWRIKPVAEHDSSLIDRTGSAKLATTDPVSKTISISDSLEAPMLDKVLLHEIAHAITVSHGLLDGMHSKIPETSWIDMEEWSASLVENHAIEASILASQALGRPLCIMGSCINGNL